VSALGLECEDGVQGGDSGRRRGWLGRSARLGWAGLDRAFRFVASASWRATVTDKHSSFIATAAVGRRSFKNFFLCLFAHH